MTVSPAHSYKLSARSKGRSPELIEKALDTTKPARVQGFPAIYSLSHISHYSGVHNSYLKDVIERSIVPYKNFKISKRSGGYRFLHAPGDRLKKCQRWINSEILSRAAVHPNCYSFHSGASIVACASMHCGARWLVKIDIERFFDSINEVDVYQVFRGFGYPALVAFELARICTFPPQHVQKKSSIREVTFRRSSQEFPFSTSARYFGRLPQGAPTSAMLSNLVFSLVDSQISEIADRKGLVYTRYADDICLSSSDKSFSRRDGEELIKAVYRLLKKSGYTPNKAKLKIISPGAKKIVLGLNVDHLTPKLTRQYKSKISTHLWAIEKFGISVHARNRRFRSVLALWDHVNGLISFARSVEPEYGNQVHHRFKVISNKSGLPF